jgi:hypothetical protein
MHKNLLWKDNIRILEENDPDLATRVKKVSMNALHKLIHSRNGYPNVIVKRERDAVILYDNEDPISYCREYLERLRFQYAPIVIFYGLGLGYHLALFLEEYGKQLETHEIIIFEEDIQLFRLALEFADFQKILSHPYIHFIVGEDSLNATVKIQKIFTVEKNRGVLRSIKIIPLPANLQLSEEYYTLAVGVAKKAAQQVMVNAGNDSFDTIIGLENLLRNIEHIVSNPGIKLLYGKFKKRPGVVVAAGPSLINSMGLLKDLGERALIISCDASLKPIMAKGIRPHLVVSLERTPGTEQFFTDIESFDGIYYAVCPVVVPAAFETFKGKKIIVYRAFSHFDWIEIDKGHLSTGPSSANMAFKVAEALGCDPIILIGQDLAFGEDGNTHVKEAVYGEKDGWYHESGVYEVEGNYGKPVKTTKLWDIFRLAYEGDLEQYDGTCINATKGGAKIRGAKVMSFQDAISEYCREQFYPRQIIEKAISQFDTELTRMDELKRILKKAQKTKKGIDEKIEEFTSLLNEINDLDKEVIQPYIMSFKPPNNERIMQILNKFKDLTNDLARGDKAVFEIIAHSLQAYDVWASNESNFLKDIYMDKKCLSIATIGEVRKWLKNVGQIFVTTRYVLSETESKLNHDLKTMSQALVDSSG